MRNRITRRQFFKTSLFFAGSSLLAACTDSFTPTEAPFQAPPTPTPTPARTPTQRPTRTPTASAGTAQPETTPMIGRSKKFVFSDEFSYLYAPTVDYQDGGRIRWYAPDKITRIFPDPRNPLGTPTLRYAGNAGRKFWLDECGLVVGDRLSLGAFVKLPAENTFALTASFRNSKGANIGDKTGETLLGDESLQFLSNMDLVVPAEAVSIDVFIVKISGLAATWDSYGIFGVNSFLISDMDCRQLADALDLKNHYVPPTNYGLAQLTWKAPQIKARSTNTPRLAKILCFGDALTNMPYRYLKPLAVSLQSDLGGDGGPGFISLKGSQYGTWQDGNPANAIPKLGNISTQGTSWDEYGLDTSIMGKGLDLTHVTSKANGDRWAIQAAFTDVKIQYLKTSGGGSFRYTLDDGYHWSEAVQTDNVTEAFAELPIPGSPAGTNKLIIEVVSHPVTLLGLEILDKSVGYGLVVNKAGNSQSTTSEWAKASATQIWRDALKSIAPDLITIYLGSSGRANTSDVTYKANLKILMDACRSVLPEVNFLLISPHGDGYVNTGVNSLTGYANRLLDLAREYPCAMVNLGPVLEFNETTAGRLFSDKVNLTEAGGALIAEVLVKALK